MSLREFAYLDNNDDVVSMPAIVYTAARVPFTNSSPHPVIIWDYYFPTAEHAYQFKKHADANPELAERIRRSALATEAKALAWSCPVDQKNWDAQRQSIMLEIIRAKCAQHPIIQKTLIATGSKAIVQEHEGEDSFWGIGKNGNGRNTMGKLWMMVREVYSSSGIYLKNSH